MMMMMMRVVVWKRSYLEEWEKEKGDRVLVGMKECEMISIVWVFLLLHLRNSNKRCAEVPCVCSSLLPVQISVFFFLFH